MKTISCAHCLRTIDGCYLELMSAECKINYKEDKNNSYHGLDKTCENDTMCNDHLNCSECVKKISNIQAECSLVIEELINACKKFPPMISFHEGLAIIREEYIEVEKEVFTKIVDPVKLRKKLTHLSAMCIRMLTELL